MIGLRKKQAEHYRDCRGLAFDDVRAYMQKHHGFRVADWQSIKTVDDSTIGQIAHQLWGFCWNTECNARQPWNKIEFHHIIGGARRSDELCNVCMLCTACHEIVKTDVLPQGRILFLKWREDRQHCDWERLSLLSKKFLPDLIT